MHFGLETAPGLPPAPDTYDPRPFAANPLTPSMFKSLTCLRVADTWEPQVRHFTRLPGPLARPNILSSQSVRSVRPSIRMKFCSGNSVSFK